jgi:glycerol uptake operon antiterminator
MFVFDKKTIIPSIKSDIELERALVAKQKVIFVLSGDLLNIKSVIKRLKDAGKIVFVNVDLLEGFSSKEIIIKFLYEEIKIDGIISSKASLIIEAKKYGLKTVHKFFMIDSFSYQNMYKQLKKSQPDILEIVPGWDKIIAWTNKRVDIPIVAGGLVCKEAMVKDALVAGATAISTTNFKIWDLNIDDISRKPRVLRVKTVPKKTT